MLIGKYEFKYFFKIMIDIIRKKVLMRSGKITEYDYISKVIIVNVLLIHKARIDTILLIKIHEY